MTAENPPEHAPLRGGPKASMRPRPMTAENFEWAAESGR